VSTRSAALNLARRHLEERSLVWNVEDIGWMQRAIVLARKGNAEPGTNGIGCVIVRDGKLIGEGCNEVELRHDATAHAEIVSMRRAGQHLKSDELRGAVLYTTLQPCGMCTMASIWAKIGRIVYGAGRDDVHEMYFEDRHLDAVDFIRDAFRNDLSLEGGLMVHECAALYVPPDAKIPKGEQFNQ
jgi:tRNA(adenine34) deaminase